MPALRLDYTSHFSADVKRLKKRHVDVSALRGVIELIAQNDSASWDELRRHHRAHQLHGQWRGAHECHVANAGDWLLVWEVSDGVAILLRTGKHLEIFR